MIFSTFEVRWYEFEAVDLTLKFIYPLTQLVNLLHLFQRNMLWWEDLSCTFSSMRIVAHRRAYHIRAYFLLVPYDFIECLVSSVESSLKSLNSMLDGRFDLFACFRKDDSLQYDIPYPWLLFCWRIVSCAMFSVNHPCEHAEELRCVVFGRGDVAEV